MMMMLMMMMISHLSATWEVCCRYSLFLNLSFSSESLLPTLLCLWPLPMSTHFVFYTYSSFDSFSHSSMSSFDQSCLLFFIFLFFSFILPCHSNCFSFLPFFFSISHFVYFVILLEALKEIITFNNYKHDGIECYSNKI